MDFAPSPRVEELRGRIAAFLDEHLYPVEMEALQALDDEVGPGVPYPRVLVELRERAKELDIEGRSSMSKDELIDALRNH